MNRLTDFKLRMRLVLGLVLKAENDWREVGRPQVTVHRNYHIF